MRSLTMIMSMSYVLLGNASSSTNDAANTSSFRGLLTSSTTNSGVSGGGISKCSVLGNDLAINEV